MKLKTDFVREQFDSFSESSLKRWAHFENAGGSYMCKQVAKRLRKYHARNRMQPYYSYPASKEAGQLMDEAYTTLAGLMNVDEEWIHIGAATTANTYTLSQAFKSYMQKGQNIVVTNQDHEANSGYWRRLADDGFEVREWQVDEQGLLQEKDLWHLVDEHTCFVAFPHVSNIIGQVNSVKTVSTSLREKGVISIVDGVSFAPHAWPNIQDLGCDIYFFSAYKTYGPHQGVMAIRPEIADKLPNQAHTFNGGYLNKKFNPAGPDHAQVAALAGMGQYVETLFEKHFKEKGSLNQMAIEISHLQRVHEGKLLDEFFEGLQGMNSFSVLGSQQVEERVPTISLIRDGESGHKLSKRLTKRGIMSAGGNFYAPRVLEALGIDPEPGVLRLSFVHYTQSDDIKKLLKALRKIDE